MSTGSVLAAKRGELGLTIKQAAASTRISARHLQALEADDLAGFPAPVYALGYLRSYARFLDLEPEPLLDPANRLPNPVKLALDLADRRRSPRPPLTRRAVAAMAAALIAGGVAGYMWRQVVADPRPGARHPAAAATASPVGAAGTPALVQARPIVVGVRVTDAVWIKATIDGQPQYGDAGTTLAAGSVVYLTGVDVRITSSKASDTFISIDGRDLGPLGIGVATRDFTSQT